MIFWILAHHLLVLVAKRIYLCCCCCCCCSLFPWLLQHSFPFQFTLIFSSVCVYNVVQLARDCVFSNFIQISGGIFYQSEERGGGELCPCTYICVCVCVCWGRLFWASVPYHSVSRIPNSYIITAFIIRYIFMVLNPHNTIRGQTSTKTCITQHTSYTTARAVSWVHTDVACAVVILNFTWTVYLCMENLWKTKLFGLEL